VGDAYATFIGLEASANEILHYMPTTVPAVLQTPDYARAYLEAVGLGRQVPWTREDIESLVEVRRRRWHALDRPSLQYRVILDEATLRRPVGGPDVMKAQLEKLATWRGRRDSISGCCLSRPDRIPGLEGGFMILALPQDAISDVVYIDHLAGQMFLDDAADLVRYRASSIDWVNSP
jgi:hypothetical protein